ncbi:hypothetical protein D3C86_2242580 [compost metagenome]
MPDVLAAGVGKLCLFAPFLKAVVGLVFVGFAVLFDNRIGLLVVSGLGFLIL